MATCHPLRADPMETRSTISNVKEGPMMRYPHPFWSIAWKDAFHIMKSSENGLKRSEVTARLSRYGRNVTTRRDGLVMKSIVHQLLQPSFIMILAVAVISLFIGDAISAAMIAAIAVLSALLGFIQEYRSEASARELYRSLAHSATVVRDGQAMEIGAAELVPGDVVELAAGRRVPADLRLMLSEGLMIDESMLTGARGLAEKIANVVAKQYPPPQEAENIAFSGSIVREGRGIGLVIATGDSVCFRSAHDHSDAHKASSFLPRLGESNSMMLRVAILGALLVFAVNAYVGHSTAISALLSLIIIAAFAPKDALSIARAADSNAAAILAKEGITAKDPSVIERLSDIDILCCDKTGTLTEGRLGVSDYIDIEGERDETPLLLAFHCCSAVERDHAISGNPIDVALMRYARRMPHLHLKAARYEKMFSVPFDHERRRMSAVVRTKGADKKYFMVCKGAPEAVLAVSSRAAVGGKVVDIRLARKKAMEQYVRLSEKGCIVIAVAIREVRRQDSYTKASEKDLTFVGFIAFIDPPKRSAKETLDLARKHGIIVKILTGDGPTLAKSLARNAGFDVPDESVIMGSELDSILGKKEEAGRLDNAVIFARVTPAQKRMVIAALRSKGGSVAYLGDDMHDAPALEEADVGIATERGSDAAKEAADAILASKSLNSVIRGAVDARGAFARVIKRIRCASVGSVGAILVIAAASSMLGFIPLIPSQLLAAVFLVGLPLVALAGDRVDESELRKPKESEFGNLSRDALLFGLISAIFGMTVVIFLAGTGGSVLRTVLFLEIVFAGALGALMLRTTRSIVKSKLPSLAMVISVLAVIAVGAAAAFPPLAALLGFETPVADLMVFASLAALGSALVTEIVKWIAYRRSDGSKSVARTAVPAAPPQSL